MNKFLDEIKGGFHACLKDVTRLDIDPRVGVTDTLDHTRNSNGCSETYRVLDRNASAIVLLVPAENLERIRDTTRYRLLSDELDNMIYDDPSEPAFHGKKFYTNYHRDKQAVYWALGTGFFYTADIVITAGHVWSGILDYFSNKTDPGRSLSDIRLVRRHVSLTKDEMIFEACDIYEIDPDTANIGDWRYNNYKDWAWIKVKSLDPTHVPDFAGLPVSTQKIKENAVLYCMGHGLGLPMMFSFKWKDPFSKYDDDDSSELFECKLHAYSGNSGSPVFRSDTHEVVGIVSGEELTRFQVHDNKIKPRIELGGDFGLKCARLDMAIKSIETYLHGA